MKLIYVQKAFCIQVICLIVFIVAYGYEWITFGIASGGHLAFMVFAYTIVAFGASIVLCIELFGAKERIQSIFDLSSTYPGNLSEGWIFEAISDCKDDETRLLMAQICANNVCDQKILENLIIRFSEHGMRSEIVRAFRDKLYSKFDTLPGRHIEGLLTESDKGKHWNDVRVAAFFRVLQKMLVIDGTDYGKIEAIGAAVVEFLRNHPIEHVSLRDRVYSLLSVKVMEGHKVLLNGYEMYAFMEGVRKELERSVGGASSEAASAVGMAGAGVVEEAGDEAVAVTEGGNTVEYS